MLFLGTLEPRKNLIRLIKAFALLKDPDLHLVLAGAQGWFYQDILQEVERSGVADRVRFPGFVPSADQALWYNAADGFAYVSVYEGFGMPVLEALACGTPTVTSSTTSLPEAGGHGAVLVPPDDEHAIAAALHAVLTMPHCDQSFAQRGMLTQRASLGRLRHAGLRMSTARWRKGDPPDEDIAPRSYSVVDRARRHRRDQPGDGSGLRVTLPAAVVPGHLL